MTRENRFECVAVAIIFALSVRSLVRTTEAFTSKPGNSQTGWRPNVHTALEATIDFKGEASTSIHVPFPSHAASPDHTLPNWLLSPRESDKFFLGTDNVRPNSDAWEALQPSVDWFGLELVPVFVIKLERCAESQRVSTNIQEARCDILSGTNTVTGKIVSKLMKQSTFHGGNTVAWRDNADSDGWILQANLSLTLSIPLPAFLPLPPGFNSIGSRIVKSTCRKRLQQNVVDLQEAYLQWACLESKVIS